MRRADAGFTLIEMLVSLVLLGMAGVLILAGLSSGAGLWRGERRLTSGEDAVASAQSLLRDKIERLRPATRFDNGQALIDLDGDAAAFSFISLPADAERPAAMRRYRLHLTARSDLALATADGGEAVLLPEVEAMTIAYFGADPASPAEAWRAAWSGRTTPPRAVRIRLTFPPGDRRVWPELIVRPAAVVDALCTLDPVDGSCRGRL